MKKKIQLLFVFVLSAFMCNAQDIIGTWKVIQLFDIPQLESEPGYMENMRMLKSTFVDVRFTISSDHKFSFDNKIEGFQSKDTHWKYDEKSNTYIIQEWADKDKNTSFLMIFKVERTDGKIFFVMDTDELYFKMEVIKI